MIKDFFELTTPPTEEPVTFTEAQDWCRDIDVADTNIVNLLIESARSEIEKAMNRVFVQRSFTGKFSDYAFTNEEIHLFVELRRAPLIAVSEVRVNGTALASTDYVVRESPSFSRILFPNINRDIDDELAFAIEVDFTAGYGAASAVPSEFKLAIQEYVLFLYENRGDVDTDGSVAFPLVTKKIVRKNRIINSYG